MLAKDETPADVAGRGAPQNVFVLVPEFLVLQRHNVVDLVNCLSFTHRSETVHISESRRHSISEKIDLAVRRLKAGWSYYLVYLSCSCFPATNGRVPIVLRHSPTSRP